MPLPIADNARLVQNEVRLWRAVLDQTFADAFSDVEFIEPEEKEEAIRWFEEADEDFIGTCEMAMIEPATVLRIYKHFKERVDEDS